MARYHILKEKVSQEEELSHSLMFDKKLRIAFVLAGLLLISGGKPLYASPPEQFKTPVEKPADIDNARGIEYSKSKEGRQAFRKTTEDAKRFCQKYLKENPGVKNLAIVSDIDETILDNRGLFKRVDKFSWPVFIEWVKEAEAPSLKPTADFLKWARKNGFSIFLITGRPEKLRSYTIQNLVRNGIAYDGLYMRPEINNGSAIAIKTKTRKEIEDMGFKIVVNIGDQVSDLVGGHALDCEKLPNKMYFVK